MGRYHFEGLSSAEVVKSREISGSNELDPPKIETFWEKLLDNFQDPLIKILCVALAITGILAFLGFANWLEGIGIAMAVFLATFVSTYSEFKNEASFQDLQKKASAISCTVYRNGGHLLEIQSSEIVVGDYVLLQSGDRIPADGRLAAGELLVNNAVLNGEYASKKKLIAPPHYVPLDQHDFADPYLVFRGAVVDDGEAVLLVESVGKSTVYGQLAADLCAQLEDRESPLQFKLNVLAEQISKLGYIMATFIAVSYLFKQIVMDNHWSWTEISTYLTKVPLLLHDVVTSAILAIIIIVVAVPEGLPMMIAIVLSLNMRRLLKARVLVRKLLGIETAGSMSLLFADKTGTMTKGRFEPCSFISGYCDTYTRFHDMPKDLAEILATALKESASSVINVDTGDIVGGNASDKALLSFLDRDSLVAPTEVTVERQILFNSERKFSASQVLFNNKSRRAQKFFSGSDFDHHQRIVFIKGAPDILLPKCKNYYDHNGAVVPFVSMTPLLEQIDMASCKGQRLIAVGTYRQPIQDEHTNEPPASIDLIGVIGVLDQIRPSTKGAVIELQHAGVQTVMVTGDKLETAAAMAVEAALIEPGDVRRSDVIITSLDLKRMSDEQIKTILPSLRVVARALPTDKSRLVSIAQQMGCVVGMTGDGINDSAALRRADVGFAMGSGAEVAKEVADIVILDDNFASITKAVLYGRTIFKSIRKFIVFQSTINLASTFIVFFGPFLGFDFPLTLTQLLWVNLVMDTLAALAFGGEVPLESTMTEKPIKREDPIIDIPMWSSILIGGIYIALLSIIFLTSDYIADTFVRGGKHAEDVFLTAFFCFFIYSATFNAFNVRTPSMNLLENVLKNRNFVAVVGFIMFVQWIMTYVGGSVLRTVPLTAHEWFFTLFLSSTVLPIDLFRKFFILPRILRNFATNRRPEGFAMV